MTGTGMATKTPDPEGFASIMRAIAETQNDDPESSHSMADGVMVGLLRDLGYGEAMDIYTSMTKWCA